MSSSSHSATEHSHQHAWGPCGSWGKKGNWSGVNIAAMVLGFVFFWPIGLFLVYWILTGRNVQELPPVIKRQWARITGKTLGEAGDSDNIVFNEYQNTQYDRIREIKEEIRERSRRFAEYRENAKRRADEEEFNQFMASAPLRNE